jgi:hypothetical protein
MMTKRFVTIIFLVFLGLQMQAQIITGKVINELDGEPIEYVSIGVVRIAIGTITNETGDFKLDTKGLPIDSKVRISMVGFQTQTFTIDELSKNSSPIKLKEQTYTIAEVIVKPKGVIRKVGTTSSTRGSGLCGWGGTQFGSGHELGTKIDLGNSPVMLKSLHVKLYKQSFDSTLLRLHIRNIADDIPNNELLKENVILNVSKESGWVDFDISKYGIVLNGEISLSLEWLKVYGVNENRLIRMNKEKVPTANVLFSKINNAGIEYVRKGSEAKWVKLDNQSPSFYLTIVE